MIGTKNLTILIITKMSKFTESDQLEELDLAWNDIKRLFYILYQRKSI